jgi:hypothetical protein
MTTTAFRRIARLLALALLVSCGDDSTAPPPAETNVTLESGNAASETIGVEGGTIQTTANDGTVYTLEIPEGSISENQTITMTPVVDIDGYPVADGVAAGVDLKPAGLVFSVPAILTIETTATPGTGLVPIAITYEGDASSFAPGFVGSGVGTFTIPIEHFSGWTVGFATAAELETIANTSGAPQCMWSLLSMTFPGDQTAGVALLRSCFASDILPAINQATTDRQLSKAIGQYNVWKSDARVAMGMLPFDDSSETQQAMDALVPKLQQAIIANNDQCRQRQSFLFAAKVLFWQRQAAHFGIDTVANLLDRNTVLSNLCLRVVVDSFQLPANMQVGFPHSLDVQFGVIFGGQTTSQGAPFAVTVSGTGVSIQNPTGNSDSQGKYTTVVTATQSGGVSVTARGCLVIPGTTTPTDICIQGQGGSSGQDLTGIWCGTETTTEGGVPESGFFHVTIVQTQNGITGSVTSFWPGDATLAATLSGTQLLNASLSHGNQVLSGTGAVNGSTITLDLTMPGLTYHVEVTRSSTPCPL